MRSLKEEIAGLEKQMIIHALQDNDWVMARAAREIGITERMIGYKIKKYDIKREVEKENIQQSEAGSQQTKFSKQKI
ncbi:MAG: helix-turn-helix domain-containing protein [Nitrospira sp.]|nr:helix-turn-helix domain-containing protein [Candidatus Brocadiales bacterium]MBL7031916.1 helix-turn-helix domain-containing protein [Nitrospira sp.]